MTDTGTATGVLAAARHAAGGAALITDPDALRSYAHDEAEWAEHVLPAELEGVAS